MKLRRLSKITIALGIYIVASAAFMLKIRNWLFKVFGNFIVVTCFRLFFILIFVLTITHAFRISLNLFKICAVFVIFILGYLFSMWQPYFSEKTHVLTYGLLGYLAANDFVDTKRKLQFKNVVLAICFVASISALDEIFQSILPYRVGDARDFITNVISGAFGMGLLLTLKNE